MIFTSNLDPLVKSGMPVDYPLLSSDYSLIGRFSSVFKLKMITKTFEPDNFSFSLSNLINSNNNTSFKDAQKSMDRLGLGTRVRNLWEDSEENHCVIRDIK